MEAVEEMSEGVAGRMCMVLGRKNGRRVSRKGSSFDENVKGRVKSSELLRNYHRCNARSFIAHSKSDALNVPLVHQTGTSIAVIGFATGELTIRSGPLYDDVPGL